MTKTQLANFTAHLALAAIFWLVTLFLFATDSANADDLDEIQAALGAKGQVSEGALVVRFPRSDISVSIDGDPVPTAAGFVSWLAWKNMGDASMVMGDLVLLEKEVNPVISALEAANIRVTALHNHFMWDQPRVMFMHIGALGKGADLARGIKAALDKTATPPQTSAGLPPTPMSLDTGRIEQIVGSKGTGFGGVFKITVGRAGVRSQGMELTSSMGMNSWAAFFGTNKRAHVAGDLAMTAAEVEPVILALRNGGIDVLAVHNHMLDEVPRIFFLHYWGTGPVDKLAESVRAAFEQVRGPVK